MQAELFKRVISLVEKDNYEQVDFPPGAETYEDKTMIIERIEITPEIREQEFPHNIDFDSGYSYNVTIKSPIMDAATKDENYNTVLSRISMLCNPANPKQTMMQIKYAGTSKYNQRGDFNIADHHYHNLLSMETNTKEERQEFLKELGRLNHLMAHLLPVKRGNAGICEWITRAIAFKKGIELGEFNRDEPLSWDFQALVTPDREVYANWYASSAILDMVVDSGYAHSNHLTL